MSEGNGTTQPSVVVDCSGASRVDVPPPNGQYDFTITKAEVKLGKIDEKTGGQSMFAILNYQLDTEPARGRHIFGDMLMIRLKDGSIPGTAAAIARNYTTPFTYGAILDAAKLPSNAITTGEVPALVGLKLRGVFRVGTDTRGDAKLGLSKVVGQPTGKGFTASAPTTRPDTEDFS